MKRSEKKFRKKQENIKQQSKPNLGVFNVGYQIRSGLLSFYKISEKFSKDTYIFNDAFYPDLYKLKNLSDIPYFSSDDGSFSLVVFPDKLVNSKQSVFGDKSKSFFGESYSDLESFFKKEGLEDLNYNHLNLSPYFSKGNLQTKYLLFDNYYLELSPRNPLDHLIQNNSFSKQGPVIFTGKADSNKSLRSIYMNIILSKYSR